jgi:hypothetical protein
MNRKEYIKKSLTLGLCAGTLLSIDRNALAGYALPPDEKDCTRIQQEKEFVQTWLSDLLESMDRELDEQTRIKLIEGCGRACFNRYQFKKDIAIKGKGDIDKLIEAYKQNFEIWREGDKVHIRYGEVSPGCYCPAAKYRPVRPNDLHCECTRTTHQTIFETALDRPFKVDILETVRRGGKTCHFQVHLT